MRPVFVANFRTKRPYRKFFLENGREVGTEKSSVTDNREAQKGFRS
jgi:hypothetical protein